jgi:hypothetical protein
MGTNFMRIPMASEMDERKLRLIEDVTKLELTPFNIERHFNEPIDDSWGSQSVWDKFIDGSNIHLGKRSGGWKFCWNFHDNKYYSNKEELLSFIRSGRVVDEYGDEHDVEDFITMALEWGEPDGNVLNAEYEEKKVGHKWGPKYYDLIIDGLRVSTSTKFS